MVPLPGVDRLARGGLVQSRKTEWQCQKENPRDRGRDAPANGRRNGGGADESTRSSGSNRVNECSAADCCCTWT